VKKSLATPDSRQLNRMRPRQTLIMCVRMSAPGHTTLFCDGCRGQSSLAFAISIIERLNWFAGIARAAHEMIASDYTGINDMIRFRNTAYSAGPTVSGSAMRFRKQNSPALVTKPGF